MPRSLWAMKISSFTKLQRTMCCLFICFMSQRSMPLPLGPRTSALLVAAMRNGGCMVTRYVAFGTQCQKCCILHGIRFIACKQHKKTPTRLSFAFLWQSWDVDEACDVPKGWTIWSLPFSNTHPRRPFAMASIETCWPQSLQPGKSWKPEIHERNAAHSDQSLGVVRACFAWPPYFVRPVCWKDFMELKQITQLRRPGPNYDQLVIAHPWAKAALGWPGQRWRESNSRCAWLEGAKYPGRPV